MSSAEFENLIRSKIENLRPKLLDLSRRNPLISTRLSTRSSSLVRVVDELPEVIRFNLGNGLPMRFDPLPPLEDDPRDEQTDEFQDALSSARLSDEAYQADLDAIDPNKDDSEEIARRIERNLKDRVRATLDMVPRQQKADLSLPEHAAINGIAAHWELPFPDDQHADGRHTDESIQTLMLPNDLERKLNALVTKCRTWQQETGINVFHAAFGFLEWKEPNSSSTVFSPLVLLPVQIEKKKTREGAEFWVSAEGDDTEANFVLAEKMRLEFGIEIPLYEGGSVEEYFAAISEAAPKTMPWRVRRQVAFGVFPSARMAMYQDLDTTARNFGQSEVIATLFGGADVGSDTPFADEYDVDDPAIEVKAPYLVNDADSSQFSAIVDITEGKNLAVEGPPGTGKSQTIVNTIANALGQGKKVLFVAEKMAALEVVKSRLEAVGLGEFVLPLQADRSSREQVISSVRDRMEMGNAHPPADYQTRIDRFRQTRSELTAYIEVIAAPFGRTGMTVHDILGKGIATSNRLDGTPRDLQSAQLPDLSEMSRTDLETLLARAEALVKISEEALETEPYWDGLEVVNLDRFAADDLSRLAEDASRAFRHAAQAREKLAGFGLPNDVSFERLKALRDRLEVIAPFIEHADADLVARIVSSGVATSVLSFLADCKVHQAEAVELLRTVSEGSILAAGGPLRILSQICTDHQIDSLDRSSWQGEINRTEEQIVGLRDTLAKLKQIIDYFPTAKAFPLRTLIKAGEIVRSTDREVLLARSETTADPIASSIISRLCSSGRDLQEQKELLGASISTVTDLSVGEIRSSAETIDRSGVMSAFSGTFRKAKREYLSLSKAAGFEKSRAVQSLQGLARWKEAVQRYGEDHQARTLFGLHFRGVETDFFLFESLCDYYARVDAAFPGPAHREIRSLLKSGDLDLITAIPDIQIEDETLTFHDLESSIIERERQLGERKGVVAKATELLKGLREPIEISPHDLPVLVERLEVHAERQNRLSQNDAVRNALGHHFAGSATDCETLSAEIGVLRVLNEAGQDASTLAPLLKMGAVTEARDAMVGAIATEAASQNSLSALIARSGETIAADVRGRPATLIADYLANAALDREGMLIHSRFATACKDVEDLGYGWIIDCFEDNELPLHKFKDILEAVVFRAMTRQVFDKHGAVLSKYTGSKLDDLRATLARLDKEIIKLTQRHLRSMIKNAARPPYGNGRGKRSTFTELALLENEIAKKQRFLPVRDLTRRAGLALLELKPCWMMSPLAVAQYLPPDAEFDLCIIDEASQMPPEDAVGALYRARQTMVVGDTNQLPPTSFFKKMIEDEDADEDEVVEDESVLEMANAVFRPRRRLRWHYRSKHSGLIQFSNQHIYGNDLVVFPSPVQSHPQMGVSLVSVDGDYKSGVNTSEARVMIDAALQFMRETPKRSLGLVTLNQKQRDLLLEEWERAVNRDTAASRYVEYWQEQNDGLEQFFIKNLENVQGDERDAIFIGTVYGPESVGGPVMQRFGPISGLAGKRRLNVLFSRAKEQIVTFSSMTAADIRADENGNPGAFMLKRWLEYSATGKIEAGEHTNLEPDSDFEVFVIDQLRAMGCIPVPQVGVAGFRIDIGVKHTDWPHGFIMGVECDGATYHSSRSARDRDRLREQVLTGLGWHLHRIWSTDWFQDPRREAERLRRAVESRMEKLKSSAPPSAMTPSQVDQAAVADPADSLALEETPPPARDDAIPKIETEGGVPIAKAMQIDVVQAGDKVRVRYLDGDQASRVVVLSDRLNDPSQSIVHVREPLGRALLGAELDEEIEILIGNSVRPAIIEHIEKGLGSAGP